MVFRLIASRFRIGFLGMTACSLLYALRVNLSVAIVAMVNQTRGESHAPDSCISSSINESDSEENTSAQFDWNLTVQGFILSAYFYGFTATQIMGGIITDKWGAKWVCGLGIGVPAVVNALSPFAAKEHYIWLIVIRVIIGAFHGLVNASLFSMYAKWFPIQERTIAIAATQFGGNIGAVVISPLSGFFSRLKFGEGWPTIFYFSSLIHCIWLIMWCCSAHNSPAEDNGIDPDEHLYILQNTATTSSINKRKASVPWKAILSSPAIYASIFAKTSGTFGYYVLATSVPSYLSDIFNLKITENGLYTALMYLAIAITLMSAGSLSNFVIIKTRLTRTRVRKLFQMIALVGPAICLLIIPSVGCELIVVIVLIVFSMCLYGFITGGEYPIIPEYAPEFTGTVFGFTNTLASSMGFVAPIIVGQILDSGTDETVGTRQKWNVVFYTTAAFYLFGALIFEIFGSAKPQPWAKIKCRRNDDIEMSEIHNNINNIIKNKDKNVKNRSIFEKLCLKPKTMNTRTPEWINFKRNTYVY